MSNKKRNIALSLLCAAAMGAQAQVSSVHGTVSDEFGPAMGVTVCEIDATGRIIESTVTDMSGNFTMRVRNDKDKIRFSYTGSKTVTMPINRQVYKVTLTSAAQVKEVVVKAKKKLRSGGLAIPEREVSFATQTISMKEFEGLGITSVDEALQGRISGLDIIANSGNLGAGTTMRLRGASSVSTLTSSNPLIVVNGNTWNVDMSDFNVNTANDEQFAQLLNVNPEDIQSITVLKDAAATAIYGSQGGNGVIEITTKRGSQGAPKVSYSLRLTGTYQPQGYKMLNGNDYTMLLKESYFNPEQSYATANVSEINYDPTFSEYEQYNNNTDWVDEVTQVGLRQNHYLSVTGGGEKATFRIAGGFDQETGSVIEQKLSRFSTRVALDYYVSDRIKIATNFSMTYTKNKRNYTGATSATDNGVLGAGLLALAYKKMPNMSVYRQDPKTGADTDEYYTMLQSGSSVFNDDQKIYPNPVAVAKLAKNDDKTYDIMPELVINYNLLGLDNDEDKWKLNYEGRVYMNIFNEYVDTYYPASLTSLSFDNGVNLSSATSSKNVSFTTKQTLTLTPAFKNKDHSLMALARFELTSGSNNSQYTAGKGLPSGGITSPDAGGTITDLTTNYSQWRSMYYTFSTHYAYKSRYMFDFSLRVDGTSKFGPDKRWGYFPAVSLRWNISDEPWMKWSRKVLSMWSVRPSWGIVGNAPGTDYLYMSKYGSADNYIGQSTMKPLNIRLGDLKWEKKTSYDVGMDIGLFDDRLQLTLDWYHETTRDMLMENVSIASSTGFSTLAYQNVGAIRNIGWEFNINTNELFKFGDFGVDFNATFGNNRNEIIEMDPTVLETLNTKFEKANRAMVQRVQVNNPFGAIYGFRYKGVYQYQYETYKNMDDEQRAAFIAAGKTAPVAQNAEGKVVSDPDGNPVRMTFGYSNDGTFTPYEMKGGDAIYEDVNHDGNINELDIVYLGSSLPKLTGGFGFNLKYKRWKLNAQFNYRVGNKILNLARLDAEAMVNNNNQSEAVNYRWRKEGDVTTIPRAMYGSTSNYNTLISDRFLESGSFLRLNYLQLSYSFAQKTLKKSLGINGLRFYLSANNLFCLTEYTGADPEVGYGSYGAATDEGKTPRAKSYTLGVTVDF